MQEEVFENAEYNDDSIDGFEYAERVRQRPAVMLGSDGLAGAKHGFIEIYGNALDEVSSGYGDRLDVARYSDGSISVRDYGRGVPLGWNSKKGMYNWHLVYNEMYMGGKTGSTQSQLRKVTNWDSFDPKSINYLFAVGLNGLGAAATQYSSEYFDVKSFKGGFCTEMHYRGGYPIVAGEPRKVDKGFDWSLYQENKYPTDEPDGTFVRWKPDDKVFKDTNITFQYLKETCQDIACVAHITVNMYDEDTDTHITFEAGDEEDLLKNKLGSRADDVEQVFRCHNLTHGYVNKQGENFIYVDEAEIVFTFVDNNAPISFNHNFVKMYGGAHNIGYNRGLVEFLAPIANQAGVRLTERDYADTLACVISTRSNDSSFQGQTKFEVDNEHIIDIIASTITTRLNTEYAKDNKFVHEYVDMILERARIRVEQATKAKISREMSKMARQKKPEKFSTCEAYEKRLPGAELWLAEGDSAKGAIVAARQYAFQAALPLRGKVLNVEKASVEEILANEEIKSIFALLDTGMDLGGDASTFDISRLRFDKIVFATDADEDGFQIRVLLFLVFYRLAPQLLMQCGVDEKGRPCSHVFIAETPRFGIQLRNGEVKYVNTDVERDRVYAEYAGQVVNTQRYKGLGETSKEVLSLTTVHPDTRNLIPIVVDFNDSNLRDCIDTLFGKDKFKIRKSVLAEILGGDVLDMMSDVDMKLEAIENSEFEDDTDYEDVTL